MPSMGPQTTAPIREVSEDEIVSTALRAALAGDFDAAQKALDLATGVANRASAATRLVVALAPQEPPKAARLALALPPGPTRASALEAAMGAWAKQAPDEALRRSLEIEDPTMADVARRAIARILVEKNPREALQRLQTTLPANQTREEMIATTAGAWARRDSDGAIAWLREQRNDSAYERFSSTVAFELAQVSPTRAIEIAEILPAGRNRWLILSGVAQTWVAQDQDAAISWANRLPPGEARDAAIAGINTGLGLATVRRSPSPSKAPGISRSRSAYTIGSENDPPAFAAWLATQPQPMSRDEAILEYVRQRGSQDSGAIGSWLANLTGQSARARAMEIYFQEILQGSPATAANWISSLPNSDRSDVMIENVARQWLRTDARAAEAWLRETNLPFIRQEEILKQIPR